MDIPQILDLFRKIMPQAQRRLELLGAPMMVFQTDTEAVWVLEDGSVNVATFNGQDWVWADDDLSLEVLKMALFEYALQSNFDQLVRGKAPDENF